MSENLDNDRLQSLITAHAVLRSVRHVLQVSTDLEDARAQVQRLLELVEAKAREEQIPLEMLREQGRELLMDLL